VKITIGPSDVGGSGYYRLLAPYRDLAAHKPEAFSVTVADSLLDPAWATCDIAIFHRPSTAEVADFISDLAVGGADSMIRRGQKQVGAALLKRISKDRSRPVVAVDVDLNLEWLPRYHAAAREFGTCKIGTGYFERAARMADFLICATPELQNLYADFNPYRCVLHSALADAEFKKYAEQLPVKSYPKRLDQIRIGYTGAPSDWGDFRMVVKPLQRVMAKCPEARVVVMGIPNAKLLFRDEYRARVDLADGLTSKRTHNTMPSLYGSQYPEKFYPALVALDLDIAILPLERNPFNRCVSPIRAFEHAMMGVPVVVARYGSCDIPDPDDGPAFLKVSPDDERAWERALLRLCDDDERARWGQAGRKYVMDTGLLSDGRASLEDFLTGPGPTAPAAAQAGAA
jgi:glycosyltransferase involved in cell wall biosynthesis